MYTFTNLWLYFVPFFQILSPLHRRFPPAFHRLPPLAGGLFFVPPCRMDLIKVFRQGTRRPPESAASGFCRCYALCLPFLYAFPLTLGHKRQNLQNQIGNKCPQQVLALPYIQKRHIQDTNIYTLFLRKQPPLLLNLLVIAPQPINAQDIEYVSPGRSRLTSRLYLGRSKSLPDCLSIYNRLSGIPFPRSTTSCRFSFWTVLETRMYPYSIMFHRLSSLIYRTKAEK